MEKFVLHFVEQDSLTPLDVVMELTGLSEEDLSLYTIELDTEPQGEHFDFSSINPPG